jgi:hypothetical protein
MPVIDMYADVWEFNDAGGVRMAMPGSKFTYLPYLDACAALDLVSEEFEELKLALAVNDVPEIADAIVDSIYTVMGIATRLGETKVPRKLKNQPAQHILDVYSRAHARRWGDWLDKAESDLLRTVAIPYGDKSLTAEIAIRQAVMTLEGIALHFRFPMETLWKLVHQSNMSKRDPETGKFVWNEARTKIIKPKGWLGKPDIAEALNNHELDLANFPF